MNKRRPNSHKPPKFEYTKAALEEYFKILPKLEQGLNDAETDEEEREAKYQVFVARLVVSNALFEDIRYTPHYMPWRRTFGMTVDDVKDAMKRIRKTTRGTLGS
jgi:hypothetical protein